MNFKEIKAKIKKEKRKREIKKMGKKLASGVGFVATVSLATAALLYANSDDRGKKEFKQVKKAIKEIPKQVKDLEKDIPREARKFEKELKEIIE